MSINKSLFSSKSDEWSTPRTLFNFWDNIYHFTLDAAATSSNALTKSYFTLQTSALDNNWGDNIVWCNPPYSRGLAKQFIAKAVDQVIHQKETECAVFLLPVRTDTKMWHELIFPRASEIVYLKGRVKFENDQGKQVGSAPFPSAIVVFQRDQDRKNGVRIGCAPADPSAPNAAIEYITRRL